MALFYSYLSQARADESDADVALAYIDHMTETAAQVPMVPGLYMGFTGVAWVIEHLAGRLFEPEEGEEDSHREIDETLIRALRQQTWTRGYDLISGLVGFGVYALGRLPRPTARECLELLVLQLEALAVEHPPGVTWHTKPDLLPESQRRVFPHGYYNAGMAHGVPAVIAILAEICAADIVPERSRPLLDGAVRWLLAQEMEPGATSCFPTSVGEGIESQPARLAWCYGDPGVAAALLLAARRVGRDDWGR